MALRTGTQRGPATLVDYLGILGGLLAPLTIGIYAVVGGLWINHDDRFDDERVAAEQIVTELAQRSDAPADDRMPESLTAQIAVLKSSSRYGPVAAEIDREILAQSAHDNADWARAEKLAKQVADDAVYSHFDDMISDLGDRNDALGTWFLIVNVAVALFLVLFAHAVFRRVPVGRWVVLLLMVAAVLSAALGLTRCQHSCTLASTSLTHWFGHQLAGGTLLILIVLIPALAAIDLPKPAPKGEAQYALVPRWLYAMAHYLPQVVVFPAVGTVLALFVFDWPAGLLQRVTWGIGYVFIVAVSLVMFRARRGFAPRRFDVTRLQENVIYGSSSRRCGRFVLGRVVPGQEERFRQQLDDAIARNVIRPEVPRPRPAFDHKLDHSLTIGFTAEGLRVLGVPHRWTATGPDAFGQGMAARAGLLGDPEPYRGPWEKPHHLVLWITAEDARSGRSRAESLKEWFGATVSFADLPAGEIAPETNLLGFADGFSNPWLADVHPAADERRKGGGKLNANLEWEPLALGEFILGEIDESRDVFPVPEPRSVFDGGTFLVLRQIEVSSQWMEILLARGQHKVGATENLNGRKAGVATMLMGRDYSGVPAAASADGDAGWANNNFRYGDDPEGFKCPLGAHVRRANPRDSLGFHGVPAHRRRMIRRGMPYSEATGTRTTKGLLFVALNARIADQFEFVQSRWLNDGDAFRLGRAPDPVAGQWTESGLHHTWHTPDGPVTIPLDEPISRPVGGAYFLVPSMAGLEAIARKAV